MKINKERLKASEVRKMIEDLAKINGVMQESGDISYNINKLRILITDTYKPIKETIIEAIKAYGGTTTNGMYYNFEDKEKEEEFNKKWIEILDIEVEIDYKDIQFSSMELRRKGRVTPEFFQLFKSIIK